MRMTNSLNGILALTINGGSSSIKFGVFEANELPRRVLRGAIQRIGSSEARLTAKNADSSIHVECPISAMNHSIAIEQLMGWLADNIRLDRIGVVGHRVVHGGPRYFEPQQVNDELLSELRRLTPFDPQHLPEETLLLEQFSKRLPNTPQIACFDTAFHHDLPIVSQLLPIPRRYFAAGVRRYGFHGLSYAYLMEELERLGGTEAARGKVALAHLGNGASIAAVRDGKPLDTTMGFTPTGGVPMSTRSGDLDPGVMSYLARTERMNAEQLDHVVNFESGLLGVSEKSSDMRDLLDAEPNDSRAAEAVASFCYGVKKCIGAFAAALGGLDTLIFSAGIGENVPEIRRRICDGLEFLGITVDQSANATNAAVISTKDARVTVRVIATDEELMIAKSIVRILGFNKREGQ
jgi:acetate kinase